MAISVFDIVGYGILLVIVVFVVLTLRVLIKKYKDAKNVSTLYFAIAYIFFMGAIVTLLLEKVGLLIFVVNPSIELEFFIRINAVIALACSGAAIVLINLFAFENTFSEKKIILTVFIAICVVCYFSVLAFANFNGLFGGPLSEVTSEISYDPIITLFGIGLAMPIAIAAPGVFFYFAAVTTEKANARRSMWMGLAIILFFFGYLLETTSFTVAPSLAIILELVVVIGRTLMAIAAVILYTCFAMPTWFKKRIGWTED